MLIVKHDTQNSMQSLTVKIIGTYRKVIWERLKDKWDT